MTKTKKKILTVIIILAVLIALCTCAFYHGFVVREYRVSTNKLQEGQTIQIVLITDLHSQIYGDGQQPLASLIEQQNPDIILLAGDIADDQEPLLGTDLFLQKIKHIAPCYYVTGNHELWADDFDAILKLFDEHGIHVLQNTYEEIEVRDSKLIIAGTDDPDIIKYRKYQRDSKLWENQLLDDFQPLEKEDCYKILLSHRPEYSEFYQQTPFDMVVSGHAHGGQVRIPLLLNGLYAPNQGLFPKYAGGLYQYESLVHIVSRGTTTKNPPLPRVFNPPEVVSIQLEGE